jgi:hypothetical protein
VASFASYGEFKFTYNLCLRSKNCIKLKENRIDLGEEIKFHLPEMLLLGREAGHTIGTRNAEKEIK